MAHKTFSQEQVAFSSYSFSLTLRLESEASIASSKDAVIYFIRRFDSISLFYGTNMLFLKSFSVFFFVQDRTFFFVPCFPEARCAFAYQSRPTGVVDNAIFNGLGVCRDRSLQAFIYGTPCF